MGWNCKWTSPPTHTHTAVEFVGGSRQKDKSKWQQPQAVQAAGKIKILGPNSLFPGTEESNCSINQRPKDAFIFGPLSFYPFPSQFSSVQLLSRYSLQTHGLQHAWPPCPLPTSRVYSNLCPLSWWCQLSISSSVVPFSSCLQSFPASGSFPMSQLFACSGQSIGVSASASVLPKNTQDWSPLEWTGWSLLQHSTVQKHQFFGTQPSSQSNSHIHTWPLEKP